MGRGKKTSLFFGAPPKVQLGYRNTFIDVLEQTLGMHHNIHVSKHSVTSSAGAVLNPQPYTPKL